MDRLRALACFGKVIELQSISGAARALRISKAAVSKSVASLEEELGVLLLHRTTRSVRPTAPGRAVYQRARLVLEQMQELEAAAKAEKAEPVGTLRVSAPLALGLLHLRDPIAEFSRAYPQVSIELALSDRYVRIVDEGFDVAIRVVDRLEDEDLVAVPLAKTRGIACASPDYLKRAGRPRTPRDLARHACLAYAAPGRSGRIPWRFDDETVFITPAIRTDSSMLLCDWARAGLGIACLLSFVCADDLRSGKLVPLFPRARTEELSIVALYPSPGHATARVRAFIDTLKSASKNRWEI